MKVSYKNSNATSHGFEDSKVRTMYALIELYTSKGKKLVPSAWPNKMMKFFETKSAALKEAQKTGLGGTPVKVKIIGMDF